jgi:hypothetical protein
MDAQRGVDLVGHASGHLAQVVHLLGVDEPLLVLLDDGDVARGEQQTDDFLPAAHGHLEDVEPAFVALAPGEDLLGQRRAAHEDLAVLVVVGVGLALAEEVEVRAPRMSFSLRWK